MHLVDLPLLDLPLIVAAADSGNRGQELGGLFGWVTSVIEALGPLGVALLVALENLFPPIPSEAVLPFAGFVVGRGDTSPATMIIAATIGSVVGAVALYELGRRVGADRVRGALLRLPLVNADDVDRSMDWFERHGPSSVLLARAVPLVRSLISLPAGAARMPRGRFVILTTIGSAAYNAAWIIVGYLLGERWRNAAEYSDWLSWALIAAVVVVIARFVWSRRDRIGSAEA